MKNYLYLLLLFVIFQSCYQDSGGGYYIGDAGIPNDIYSKKITIDSSKLNEIIENDFIDVKDQPISTFSVDADGGSYAHVRNILNSGQKPPKAAIRIEEFLNYFPLDYKDDGISPISLNGEISSCPWNEEHKLVRIGIKGKSLAKKDYPVANFVLLIDVSGSMGGEDKLELLKNGFMKFVDQMRDEDRLAIVTYAGNAGVLLNSTPGTKKKEIKKKIKKLGAGGSTAGAQGIKTAYEIVEDNFIEDGNNRVILGTDGDFNVGVSSQEELIELIEEKRKSGAFFTTIGVGFNPNEGMLEQLANKGNGNYEYIDNIAEMEKIFINDYNKFVTVAKDVKVQVEFDSTFISKYRLIGYVNRLLNNEDFENDSIDAGEIGAGQNITALYEIVPVKLGERSEKVFKIDFRYKRPNEDFSSELSLYVDDDNRKFDNASENMRFTSALAAYGMLLFDSKYSGNADYDKVYNWTKNAMTYNPYGYRSEFLNLIGKAKQVD